MLTRKRLGYAPGTMDVVYLRHDLDALDAMLHAGQTPCADLLLASAEFEGEARRLGVPEVLAKVLLQRATILLAHQRHQEAIAALTAADQALGALRQYDLKVGIYAALAEAQAGRGDWPAVLEVCERGIALVEAHRYRVSGQYLQSAYLRSRIGLYARGVQAAYECRQYQRMLQWAELSKCRSVLRYQQRSLAPSAEEQQTEQEFRRVCQQVDAARVNGNDEGLAALLAKRRTLWDVLVILRARTRGAGSLPEFDLARIQAALAPDEAVLYYYWLDSHTLLVVVVDHEQLAPQLCAVTPEERSALEAFCRSVLEAPTLTGMEQVDQFAPALLPPALTDRLVAKSRLLISPHRLLHALPFHALPWNGEHRYLIQRFAVTYVPNLSCLQLAYRAPGPPRVLALGVRDYRVPGYDPAPLAEAELEIDDLEQLYANRGYVVSTLRGGAVCEASVRQLEQTEELGTYTTLHIATHGYNVNSDTPMESHLFLHDSLLEGLEIANWRLGADLVVLSACCSGQRPIGGRGMAELPGDDLFGLQAAFFAAGTRRVLGSLWPVESDVARTLMTAFHRGLVAGQSPELALQHAIVDYLERAGLRKRKIFFWAPFFLSAVGRPTDT